MLAGLGGAGLTLGDTTQSAFATLLSPSADNTATAVTASGSQVEANPAQSRWHFFGDFRLRYEYTTAHSGAASVERGVLRGRLGSRFDVSPRFSLGARLVTGDPDNPRTTDVAMRDFADDPQFSLDQAYAEFRQQGLLLTAGRFDKPFTSTELLWDGDANPLGLGGHYDLSRIGDLALRLSAIYSRLDQEVLGNDDMLGGQVSISLEPADHWAMEFHAAYFDYEIGALDPDHPGGARGNSVTPDGAHYLSDFDLLDAIARIEYHGWGERWPIALTADYTRNLGARVPGDTAYGLDVRFGDLDGPGHAQFRYGYAQVETDAVLGIYSNDNITLPTNYKLHSFSLDYALTRHLFIGLTQYFYRPLDRGTVAPEAGENWTSRTRLNLYVKF
jgi:hypothetical protein